MDAAPRWTASSATSSPLLRQDDLKMHAERGRIEPLALFAARRPRGRLGRTAATRRCACMHVSDDDYWKDFPGEVKSPTPRLLRLGCSDAAVRRLATYARALRWQVLQTVDPTTRSTPRTTASRRSAHATGPGAAASTSASRANRSLREPR